MGRFHRLHPASLWAFLRAWTVLLAADWGLRLLPFARLERLLAPGPASFAAGVPDEAAVPRLVWATAAAARHHLYPMRCLPRALCLRWLLGRHGIPSALKIGVARNESRLDAHAWVEREGRPVGEGADVTERFATLG
jgi:Transglutaminase-like superfamily